MCIALEEYDKYGSFYAEGDFSGDNYANIKFQFFQCREKTSESQQMSRKCKSQEYID